MKILMVKSYVKLQSVSEKVHRSLRNEKGDFIVDHAAVAAIIIALAAIAITLLVKFLQSDMAPAVSSKILSFFN